MIFYAERMEKMNKAQETKRVLIMFICIWMIFSFSKVHAQESIPYFDLRDHISVKVKNQEKDGDCWVFAPIYAMETHLARRGIQTELSANQLERGNDYDRRSYNRFKGGRKEVVTGTLASWKGVFLESDSPYEAGLSEYQAEKISILKDEKAAYRVLGIREFEDRDVNAVKEFIPVYGAVVTNIYNSHDGQKRFPYQNEQYYNEKTAAYFCDGNDGKYKGANHQVAIVGWDDGFSKANFASKPQNDGAWICVDAQGETFGQNGFYYVSYESKEIATCMYGFTDVQPAKPGLSIMQNETAPNAKLPQTFNGNVPDLDGYIASFSKKPVQPIREVGFFTTRANQRYQLKYIEDMRAVDEDTLRESEVLAEGEMDFAGYHTIELKTPIVPSSRQYGFKLYLAGEEKPYYGVSKEGFSGGGEVRTNNKILRNATYALVYDDWGDSSELVDAANMQLTLALKLICAEDALAPLPTLPLEEMKEKYDIETNIEIEGVAQKSPISAAGEYLPIFSSSEKAQKEDYKVEYRLAGEYDLPWSLERPGKLGVYDVKITPAEVKKWKKNSYEIKEGFYLISEKPDSIRVFSDSREYTYGDLLSLRAELSPVPEKEEKQSEVRFYREDILIGAGELHNGKAELLIPTTDGRLKMGENRILAAYGEILAADELKSESIEVTIHPKNIGGELQIRLEDEREERIREGSRLQVFGLEPEDAEVEYQWKINDAVVGTEKIYIVKSQDLGQELRVEVGGQQNYGGTLSAGIRLPEKILPQPPASPLEQKKPEQHPIVISPIKGADIQVTPSAAAKGERVFVHLHLSDPSKRLKYILVDGQKVQGDSFIMPDHSVQVTAELQGGYENHKHWEEKKNIEPEKIWKVTFNRTVAQKDIGADNVYVFRAERPEEKIPVRFEFSEDGKYILVKPLHSYMPGERYGLVIEDIKLEKGIQKENVIMYFSIVEEAFSPQRK